MAKIKTIFYCQNCGSQSPKWLGKCPSCNEWNTFVEEIIRKESQGSKVSFKKQTAPILISEISFKSEQRIKTNNEEFDRVLGGGIVPGSIVLIGGEPGIGKSTLMLQISLNIKNLKVLYITGEENEQQIKLRADRVGIKSTNCYILTETSTQHIFQYISNINPDIVVIDSIQTLNTSVIESSPGSVSQVRECTAELQRFAKETETPVFLIGHITKDGTIAGPKVLEHIVDTVLQFEGDRNHIYRILRATKNRFGSTSELGIYEMQSSGLREVTNPSEILLSHHDEQYSGITVSATIEGLRPMLIETQALVSSAAYGTPQRSATGFDVRRLNMLLAVLEKRCGFRLGIKDVFLNIAGGIKVDDPAIDLGVVCAILSSNEDIPIVSNICFAAEVGLSGEIRPVSRIESRISEAVKLGMEKIYISKYNSKNISHSDYGIEIIKVSKIEEIFSFLFG
ncbi:MAG: DNA repair protein RadA [Bacteroidales bacterium]|jgi:DNA repair protein RadA/Sms